MKTTLHHHKHFFTKVRFIIATLFIVCFASQTKAQGCQAGFQYTINGNVVVFYDSSFVPFLDSIVSWTWTFGDGNTGTGQIVTHQYNSTGNYNVCLTITTALGCVNTFCQNISINMNPCQMVANILPDSTGTGLYAVVTGGTPPYTYAWSNGATNSAISNLTPGVYCVSVYDMNGCSSTDCDSSGASGCSPYFIWSMQGSLVTFQNFSAGNYTSVLWDFGDSTTSTLMNPSHSYAAPGVYTVCLTLYVNAVPCNSYCILVTVQAPFNSTLCGTIFIDQNGNGVFDSLDTYFSGQYLMIWGNGYQFTVTTDSNGYYSVNVPAGTYTISYCPNNVGAIVTLPVDSSFFCGVYYSVTIGANQTLCGFNFAVQFTSVVIEGTLFADINNNGIYDAGEPGIPYQTVSVGAFSAYSNSTGNYSISVPAGTYSIQYSPQAPYATYALTTPGTISLNASTVGNTYSGNNFGLFIPPGTTDLSINLYPHTTVTPGFPAWYDIYVCNNGITPVAANVLMVYDQALYFDNAYPVQASHNAITHTLTWNLPVIQPGSCQTIWVDFTTDSLLSLGVSTIEFVSVSPATGTDINLSNNSDTVHQISAGSWDPNNKLSVKTNTSDPDKQFISSVDPDQEITYTVNFQNTGSAPAVNIVVIDQLSSDLDAASYQLTGTSHSCTASRNGNQVIYTFSGIMLPDSNTNEAGSHGFIAFNVNALNNLAAGTVLSDNASIYFDFNLPVVTSNTHIVLVDPLGVNENAGNTHSIAFYPNPVKDQAVLDYTLSGTSDVTIEIMDMNGKVYQQLRNEKQQAGEYQLDWKVNQPAGIYFIKLSVNGVVSLTKIGVVK